MSIESELAATESYLALMHTARTCRAAYYAAGLPLPERLLTFLGSAFDWQCSGCKHGFIGKHREVCPCCGRKGYWSGSVSPDAKRWDGTPVGVAEQKP